MRLFQVAVGAVVRWRTDEADRYDEPQDADRRAAGQLTFAQLQALDAVGYWDARPPQNRRERFTQWLERCHIAYVLRGLPRITRWSDLNPYMDGLITYNDHGIYDCSPQLLEIAQELVEDGPLERRTVLA